MCSLGKLATLEGDYGKSRVMLTFTERATDANAKFIHSQSIPPRDTLCYHTETRNRMHRMTSEGEVHCTRGVARLFRASLPRGSRCVPVCTGTILRARDGGEGEGEGQVRGQDRLVEDHARSECKYALRVVANVSNAYAVLRRRPPDGLGAGPDEGAGGGGGGSGARSTDPA